MARVRPGQLWGLHDSRRVDICLSIRGAWADWLCVMSADPSEVGQRAHASTYAHEWHLLSDVGRDA